MTPEGARTLLDRLKHAGNAVKYAARAGRTDGRNKGAVAEDLRKAIWYLRRELERLGDNNDS